MDRKLRLLYEKMWVEDTCGMKPVNDKIDYDPTQLKMGIEIEKEHTTNPTLAEKIAKQHLEEDPQYYTKLKKMESGDTITEGKSGHGDKKIVINLIKDAESKGLIKYKENKNGWMLFSLKHPNLRPEQVDRGEKGYHYLRRFLQKIGYSFD